jgi:hypothetical protein
MMDKKNCFAKPSSSGFPPKASWNDVRGYGHLIAICGVTANLMGGLVLAVEMYSHHWL